MLNELLLASLIGWMLVGALAGCYTIQKIVTIIAKKAHKTITKRNPK